MEFKIIYGGAGAKITKFLKLPIGKGNAIILFREAPNVKKIEAIELDHSTWSDDKTGTFIYATINAKWTYVPAKYLSAVQGIKKYSGKKMRLKLDGFAMNIADGLGRNNYKGEIDVRLEHITEHGTSEEVFDIRNVGLEPNWQIQIDESVLSARLRYLGFKNAIHYN